MANCNECGGVVSTTAHHCPHCGNTLPTTTHLVILSIAAIIAIGLVWWAWPLIEGMACCCTCGVSEFPVGTNEEVREQIAISGICLPENVFILFPGICIWIGAFKRRW